MSSATRPTTPLGGKFRFADADIMVQTEDNESKQLEANSGDGLAEGMRNPHQRNLTFPVPHLECLMPVRSQHAVPSAPHVSLHPRRCHQKQVKECAGASKPQL